MRASLPDTNTRLSCSGIGPPHPTTDTPVKGAPLRSSTCPPAPPQLPQAAPYLSAINTGSRTAVNLYGDLVGSTGLLVGVREASGVRVGTGVSGGRVANDWNVCIGVGVQVGGSVDLGTCV